MDDRKLELEKKQSQVRHLDLAWVSSVQAFRGRTKDNVIATMEARHPNLTTQKLFYIEISRTRDHAELVTDDRARLREQLGAAAGQRVSALEGIGPETGKSRGRVWNKMPRLQVPPYRTTES